MGVDEGVPREAVPARHFIENLPRVVDAWAAEGVHLEKAVGEVERGAVAALEYDLVELPSSRERAVSAACPKPSGDEVQVDVHGSEASSLNSRVEQWRRREVAAARPQRIACRLEDTRVMAAPAMAVGGI